MIILKRYVWDTYSRLWKGMKKIIFKLAAVFSWGRIENKKGWLDQA